MLSISTNERFRTWETSKAGNDNKQPQGDKSFIILSLEGKDGEKQIAAPLEYLLGNSELSSFSCVV